MEIFNQEKKIQLIKQMNPTLMILDEEFLEEE